MPVEDAAHLVGDGLVHVPALDEHGVDRRDAAARRLARALEKARQRGEHARRIAAAHGRLARREPDLALRAREPRDRVDEQEHARALVAEVLGVRGRHLRGANALEGRDVARGHDDDALLAALGAQGPLEELADLAPALADERHDDDVGLGAARDRAEQRALADPRSGEEAHALPLAERHQAVEDAHARRERPRDGPALERPGRIAIDRDEPPLDGRPAVERPPEAVDHAAEELPRSRRPSTGRPSTRRRRSGPRR